MVLKTAYFVLRIPTSTFYSSTQILEMGQIQGDGRDLHTIGEVFFHHRHS
jgi:hypothetical protein